MFNVVDKLRESRGARVGSTNQELNHVRWQKQGSRNRALSWERLLKYIPSISVSTDPFTSSLGKIMSAGSRYMHHSLLCSYVSKVIRTVESNTFTFSKK